jgi:hypothetical protein
MAAETAAFDWLQQPELAGRRLAAEGLASARELPLDLDKAWPYRDGGWLARAHGRDGGWWGLASLRGDDVPRSLSVAVAQGTADYLEADNVFAWRFASDPALALDSMIPPAEAGAQHPSAGQAAGLQRMRLLGYKPLYRCVLRGGDLLAGDWITKHYSGNRDAQAAETYAQLGGAGDPGPVCIPRPESHDLNRRTLRWRVSAGEPLMQALAAEPRPELVRRAARVIAHLHERQAGWTRRHTPSDELATVARWARFASRVSPLLKGRLDQALGSLRASVEQLPAGPYLPSHRDFYDKQLLVDGERIVLLDLDLACLAEPELDIGNFLAHLHLRELQGSLSGAGPLSVEFTRHYWASGGAIELKRLEFYEACAHVRLACVYLVRPQWSGLAGRLLDAACNQQ